MSNSNRTLTKPKSLFLVFLSSLMLVLIPIHTYADKLFVLDENNAVESLQTETTIEPRLGEPFPQGNPSDFSEGTFRIPVVGTVRYDYAWQVLDLINQERHSYGLSPLSMDADLLDAATQRGAEIATLFDHTRPNGTACFTASDKMNGENIASGQKTPIQVVNSWMNSDGHRGNILGNYSSIGIACFIDQQGGINWVQCFGGGKATSVSQPPNKYAMYQVDVLPKLFGLQMQVFPMTRSMESIVSLPEKVSPGFQQSFALAALDPYSGNIYILDQAQVTWSVSDAGTAAVNSSGIVTFRKSGESVLTARTTGGATALFSTSISVLGTNECPVWRVYNPNSGLHHYTVSTSERDRLIDLGWNDEGASFNVSAASGNPVYRQYNPNDGNHNWSQNKNEHSWLVGLGWNDEGIAWHVSPSASKPVYRLYNPNSGEHVYTTSKGEYDAVVKAGWNGEGVAWNSI